MTNKEKGLQLSLFGLSTDQNTYQSTTWGKLYFFESKSDKWTETCRHCLLWKHKSEQTDNDECLSAPCSPQDRYDNKAGYYSTHAMPKIN